MAQNQGSGLGYLTSPQYWAQFVNPDQKAMQASRFYDSIQGAVGVRNLGLRDLLGDRNYRVLAALQSQVPKIAQETRLPAGGVPSNLVSDSQLLQQRLRRARALNQLASSTRTKNDLDLLRERINAVKSGRTLQTLGLRGLTSADAIKRGLNEGFLQAESIKDAIKQKERDDLLGSVVGATTAFVKAKWGDKIKKLFGFKKSGSGG